MLVRRIVPERKVRRRAWDEVKRMSLRAITVLLVIFALFSSIFLFGVKASNVEVEAVSSVEGAEEAVAEAFGAVLEAESAGGNVSCLLDRLGVAAGYLAAARICLRIGDFDGAVGNASLCVEALDGLVEDAETLGDKAARESSQRFWMTISGSVVGVVVVACASYLGWNWFKKRYCKRALKMKPEVAEE
jgi:hypothetical protein